MYVLIKPEELKQIESLAQEETTGVSYLANLVDILSRCSHENGGTFNSTFINGEPVRLDYIGRMSSTPIAAIQVHKPTFRAEVTHYAKELETADA